MSDNQQTVSVGNPESYKPALIERMVRIVNRNLHRIIKNRASLVKINSMLGDILKIFFA